MEKIVIAIFSVFLLSACGTSDVLEKPINNNDTVTIAATFYPLAEFARNVGGEHVKVIQVIPNGAEPHEYEPTAKDIVKIYNAEIFLVNGANLDSWAEKIREELSEKNIRMLNMAEQIEVITGDHSHEDHDISLSTNADPHFWLDPINAIKEVELIRDSLIVVDPANSKSYTANTATYINHLRELDQEYQLGLANCKQKEIITSHAAFGYLANRYGFIQNSISGISPQEEPSARTMAQLTELAKEEDIKYIFFETLVSPALSETLANEVGAQVLLLHSIGSLTNEDIIAGNNYVTLMRENLKNLKIAMECH